LIPRLEKFIIKNSSLKSIFFIVIIFLLFYICADPQLLFNRTIFYIFQGRDIERAINILKGHAIFFGPEMTGGGNLPGPLYYIFLSVALLIKANWISAWVMQFALAFLGVVFGAFYFRTITSKTVGLLWVVFFGTALFTSFYLRLFLNVSSMLGFTILALIYVNKAFSENPKQTKRRSFLLACLIIGLGIQFHFSLLSLLAALFTMQIFSSKFRLTAVSSKTAWLGLLIFALPSLPYIIWLSSSKMGIHFGVPAFYTGETEQALVSILYLLKIGMADSFKFMFFSWIKKLFFTVPIPLIILVITRFIHREGQEVTRFKPIIICALFSFIPYVNWFFSTQGMRYSMPFYISLIFLTMLLFHSNLESVKRIKVFNYLSLIVQTFLVILILKNASSYTISKFMVSTAIMVFSILFLVCFFENERWKKGRAIILSLTLMITLQNSQKYFDQNFNSNPDGYMPSAHEWSRIWTSIFKRTGWSYEVAKRKIYYVGHHVNQDPELFLSGFKRPVVLNLNNNEPDGFFVSNRYGHYLKDKRGLVPEPKTWLANQNLQSDLIEGLISGDIVLGTNLSSTNLIVPYWIKNKIKLPDHFHNSGNGYHISSLDHELTKVTSDEGVILNEEGGYIFKWNESPDKSIYNSTGGILTIIKKNNDYNIKIKVVGATISQISPWISPNWTQAWIKPYLEISCGKETKKLLISNSIGFRRDFSHLLWTPFFSGNNSLIAPFEKSFNFKCSFKVNWIALGRESSTVEMIKEVRTLPSKKLTVNL
jgi:hypothetical protein